MPQSKAQQTKQNGASIRTRVSHSADSSQGSVNALVFVRIDKTRISYFAPQKKNQKGGTLDLNEGKSSAAHQNDNMPRLPGLLWSARPSQRTLSAPSCTPRAVDADRRSPVFEAD